MSTLRTFASAPVCIQAQEGCALVDDSQLEQSHRLIYLMERLSADSQWAHRASGVRGALLRAVQGVNDGAGQPDPAALERLNESARELLVRAARELVA